MAAHLWAAQVRAGAAQDGRPASPWQRGRASHLGRLAGAGRQAEGRSWPGTEPSVRCECLRRHTAFRTLSLLPTNRVYLRWTR